MPYSYYVLDKLLDYLKERSLQLGGPGWDVFTALGFPSDTLSGLNGQCLHGRAG